MIIAIFTDRDRQLIIHAQCTLEGLPFNLLRSLIDITRSSPKHSFYSQGLNRTIILVQIIVRKVSSSRVIGVYIWIRFINNFLNYHWL